MYSYLTAKGGTKQTAKGVARTYVKKHLRHDDYLQCHEHYWVEKGSWASIRSRTHQLTTNIVNKSLLSPYDDKRYVLGDGDHTLAHGHYNTFTQDDDDNNDDFDADLDIESDLEESEKRDLEEKTEFRGPKKEDMKQKWIEREAREEANRQRDLKKWRRWYAKISEERKRMLNEQMASAKRKRYDEMTKEDLVVERERKACVDRKRYGKKLLEMSEEELMLKRERKAIVDKKRYVNKLATMTDEEKKVARHIKTVAQKERRLKAISTEKREEINRLRLERRKKKTI